MTVYWTHCRPDNVSTADLTMSALAASIQLDQSIMLHVPGQACLPGRQPRHSMHSLQAAAHQAPAGHRSPASRVLLKKAQIQIQPQVQIQIQRQIWIQGVLPRSLAPCPAPAPQAARLAGTEQLIITFRLGADPAGTPARAADQCLSRQPNPKPKALDPTP